MARTGCRQAASVTSKKTARLSGSLNPSSQALQAAALHRPSSLRFSSTSFLSISPFREALFENVESRAAVTISAARTDAIEPACTEISTTGRADPVRGHPRDAGRRGHGGVRDARPRRWRSSSATLRASSARRSPSGRRDSPRSQSATRIHSDHVSQCALRRNARRFVFE